jgi:hypothetical protein
MCSGGRVLEEDWRRAIRYLLDGECGRWRRRNAGGREGRKGKCGDDAGLRQGLGNRSEHGGLLCLWKSVSALDGQKPTGIRAAAMCWPAQMVEKDLMPDGTILILARALSRLP